MSVPHSAHRSSMAIRPRLRQPRAYGPAPEEIALTAYARGLALLAGFAVLSVTVMAEVLMSGWVANGEGNGSHGSCSSAQVKGLGTGSLPHDAGASAVTGVCVKSGGNTDGSGHSGVLGNGASPNGCYVISGVGTANVDANGTGASGCHGIGHIDLILGDPPPPPPDTPTPTPTDTTTPTDTPTVTSTPIPSPTGTPTPTPTDTSTPTPTDTLTPTPPPPPRTRQRPPARPRRPPQTCLLPRRQLKRQRWLRRYSLRTQMR